MARTVSSCVSIPGKATLPTTQAKDSNVYGRGLNAQRAPKLLHLWRGSNPLSRTGVALNPERVQGSQLLFPPDPIVTGARQPAQTIGMAHFSTALRQCHRPSFTPFPWAGAGRGEKSSTECNWGKAAKSPAEGVGGSLHCSQSRPKSSRAKRCHFHCTEHSLSGCFPSPMANRAADISL